MVKCHSCCLQELKDFSKNIPSSSGKFTSFRECDWPLVTHVLCLNALKKCQALTSLCLVAQSVILYIFYSSKTFNPSPKKLSPYLSTFLDPRRIWKGLYPLRSTKYFLKMSMEGAASISWEVAVSGAGNVLTVRGLAGSAGFLENFNPAYLNKKPVLDKYVEMSKNDLEGFAVTTITLCHCPKSATQRLLLVWLCEWQQQWLKSWQCLPTLQYLSQYPMLWFYTRGLLHITPVQWEPRTPLPSTNTAHLRYVWHSSYTLERKEEVLLCLRSLPLPATRVSLTQICLTLLFKILSQIFGSHAKQIRLFVAYTYELKTQNGFDLVLEHFLLWSVV